MTAVGSRGAASSSGSRRTTASPSRSRLVPPGEHTGNFWAILSVVVVLNLLGLVMVLSASSVLALDETGSTWSYFIKQSMWAVIATIGLCVFLYMDRKVIRRFARIAYIGVILLLVAVMVPGIGVNSHGATRWLGAGPIQIQPSEFAKLVLVVCIADLLARRSREMHEPMRTFWPVMVALGGIAVLVLAQPNLGTTLVLAAIAFAMLYVAGSRLGRLVGVILLAASGALFMVLHTAFRRRRFFAFLNPWASPNGAGYQNLQSLFALGTGHLFGLGLGASRAKWNYLPEAPTDFIFAIIGEELGLFGAVLVVGLFLSLGAFGLRTARHAADRFSMLCAVGITAWLMTQAFLNMGMVIGLGPIVGVPLPFISFGGSSLMVNMAASGLLLNIARHPRHDLVKGDGLSALWSGRRFSPRLMAAESEVDSPGTWVVIAGGGTAGHLLPGLAIARALVERGHPAATIHFVGSDRGVEAEMVPAAGFTFDELSGRGLQRRLTLSNIGAAVGLFRAMLHGIGIVRKRRPAVVVVLGGYASFACGVGAVLRRAPLVLVEQNARAGAVNRVLRWFAAASAVSFAGTDLPKAVVTGNPLRPEIVQAAAHPDRVAACAALDLPADRTVIAVFSGSLGSRRINTAVRSLVERWQGRSDLAVRHVVGRRDFAEYSADPPSPPADGLVYQCIEYEDRVQLLLQAADVAVTRAGGTVAELAALGVPSILVPLPIAPRDHQRANAESLVAAGGAVMVLDADLDTDRLARELEPMIDDAAHRTSMAEAMRAAAHPNAADDAAGVVESVARRPR